MPWITARTRDGRYRFGAIDTAAAYRCWPVAWTTTAPAGTASRSLSPRSAAPPARGVVRGYTPVTDPVTGLPAALLVPEHLLRVRPVLPD